MELGPDTSSVLSLFHALLGCNTTSLFLGIAKNGLETFQWSPQLTKHKAMKAIKTDFCAFILDSDHICHSVAVVGPSLQWTMHSR